MILLVMKAYLRDMYSLRCLFYMLVIDRHCMQTLDVGRVDASVHGDLTIRMHALLLKASLLYQQCFSPEQQSG
jgi:hypothetical protein